VDASYVTSLVDDLEQAGLAERRPHPTDRRVKTVALTAKGIDVQQQVSDLMGEPPKCLGALSGSEQRILRDLLAKAVAADPALAADRSSGGSAGGVRHHRPPRQRGRARA
jgi:DNA-binding MarR family transcriptional regulator